MKKLQAKSYLTKIGGANYSGYGCIISLVVVSHGHNPNSAYVMTFR